MNVGGGYTIAEVGLSYRGREVNVPGYRRVPGSAVDADGNCRIGPAESQLIYDEILVFLETRLAAGGMSSIPKGCAIDLALAITIKEP